MTLPDGFTMPDFSSMPADGTATDTAATDGTATDAAATDTTASDVTAADGTSSTDGTSTDSTTIPGYARCAVSRVTPPDGATMPNRGTAPGGTDTTSTQDTQDVQDVQDWTKPRRHRKPNRLQPPQRHPNESIREDTTMAMKRILSVLAAGLLLIPGLAAAEEFEGNVVATSTMLVTSPYGGSLATVQVREGQEIQVGDTIATMETTKYYASEDGVIRGIFAEPGDALSSTDAVLYIGPVSEYTISCSTNKAYVSQETKYVTIGEKVYIVSVTDSTTTGEGIVTKVDQSAYTVETTSGDFYLGKNVYIYRSSGYETESRLGRGTIYRQEENPMYGSGSLLKLYVQNGDTVTRGQLLFETVSGDMFYAASQDGVDHLERSPA